MQHQQLGLQALPEGCIANVISLTSPPDTCRLSVLYKVIMSAAESDAVWDKFIPPETHTILSQSLSNSLSSFHPKSKKDLYMALCDNPVLIDEGNMLLKSHQPLYMLSYTAKCLRIAWGDTPEYWKWISLPDSRFEKVAELRFEIRGRIASRMLSPLTLYKAFLVYKYREKGSHGFVEYPDVVAVYARSYGFDYECPNLSTIISRDELKPTAFLARPKKKINEAHQFPKKRLDGWLEVELGDFYCKGDEDEELEMISCEINNSNKGGIIVQGIEVRPFRN